MNEKRNERIMNEKVRIICNLNCSRRQMDMAKMDVYLRLNNYDLTEKEEEADYIIVTSCGFINETTKMALDEINRVKKLSSEVIVTGCVPDTDVDKLNAIFKGKVIHNTELYKFDEIFGKFHKFEEIPEVHSMDWGNDYFCVEVGRGCPENCSYCATKWAVGKLNSKPIEKCVEEIELFNKSNKNKVVINGDNVGAYGLDIKETFGTLISALPLKDDGYTALIDSFHPRWFMSYYDSVLEQVSKNRFGMIVSAIQSGSERILKLMHRKVDMVQLKERYLEVKSISPQMMLGTEVIVGFPSETEEEFMESVKFVLDVNMDWGHIFSFSPKEGTEAAMLEGRVDEDIKKRRIQYFIGLLEEKGYFVHMEEKSQAVIFCRKEVCIDADKSNNSFWQHCFDTICPDRKKQVVMREEYRLREEAAATMG